MVRIRLRVIVMVRVIVRLSVSVRDIAKIKLALGLLLEYGSGLR